MVGQHKHTQNRGPPHITPSPGPSLAPFWGGGGSWNLTPHGELSLVLLLWSGSGHHQGHFGVFKANLGTVATGHGVWLKGFK